MSTIKSNNEPKEFITVKEAMALTSLSRSTIHNLRVNNKIKWYKLDTGAKSRLNSEKGYSSAKKVLILKSSLIEYVQSCANHFDNF